MTISNKLLAFLLIFLFLTFVPYTKGSNDYWIMKYTYKENPDLLLEFGKGALRSARYENGDIVMVETIPMSKTRFDFAVSLVSQDGEVKWTKLYGSKKDDEILAVAILKNGDILLAGWSGYPKDGLVVCLDPNGNIKWGKLIGGKESDEIRAVDVAPDGSIILVGETYSETSTQSLWVIKLKPDGKLKWHRVFQLYESQSVTGLSVKVSSGGSILVGGVSKQRTAFLAKLTENGSVRWAREYTISESGEGIYGIEVLEDGTILTAGEYYTATANLFLMKLNGEGQVLWKKGYGSKYGENERNTKIYNIALTPNGDILIAGRSEQLDISAGHGVLIHTDKNGNLKSWWSMKQFVSVRAIYVDGKDIIAYGSGWKKTSVLAVFPLEGSFECFEESDVEVTSKPLTVKTSKINLKGKAVQFAYKNAGIDVTGKIELIGEELCRSKGDMEETQTSTTPREVSTLTEESYWVKSLIGIGDEEITDTAITGEGDIIAVGTTTSFGENGDVLVIRLSSKGETLWQKVYGGKGDDSAHAVAVTNNGEIIVVGQTNSFGAGDYDVWILGLDKNGNVRWQSTYGGEYGEGGLDVDLFTNGDILVVGYTGGFGAGNFDAWVLRLDPVGNIRWQRAYGGSGEDIAWGVKAVNGGTEIVVVGYTKSFNAKGEDGWIMYLDGNGNIKWQKMIGSDKDDEFLAVSEDADGNIVVAGMLTGKDDYEKGWVVKLNKRGKVLWQGAYGGEEYGDAFFDIDTAGDRITVAGGTQNFGTEETGSWVLHLDSSGNIINEFVCEEGDSMLWSVATDESSTVAVGYSTVEGKDIFIMKLPKDGNLECTICRSSEAIVRTPAIIIRDSKAVSENTKGIMKESRGTVDVSDFKEKVNCPAEEIKETKHREISSSESPSEVTPIQSPEEESTKGICGPGVFAVLAILGKIIRKRRGN
ncbi:CGP-CTERM sorting domain-containing protein [Thermococcus barophilus]|uniref:Uncharacterized protein n=1 Tax=Thermococcus barophilus TaxID=55802 RepID=A0A0S1XC45_THEBA|nr:CGP-CTERM sorting domain-containing protein [Thermococcus barophilus]ALM75308.1 conserved exported hypothetical protein [Thermococcus barophilus]